MMFNHDTFSMCAELGNVMLDNHLTNVDRANVAPGARQSPDVPLRVDDVTPAMTAQRLLLWSAGKAVLRADRMLVLGIMAGVFIGLGALFFTAVMIGVPSANGPTRLLGGLAFAMGLLLVAMTGAELSTGNCMIVAAWANRTITLSAALRVLWQSYVANALGALALSVLIAGTGLLQAEHGRVVIDIADAKLALPFGQALARAIVCNALVCLAVWQILAATTLAGKLLGLVMPISAFITIGLEHSIANFYLLSAAVLAGAPITPFAIAVNLLAVTVGNALGGCGVALAIWLAYLRPQGQGLPIGAATAPGLVNGFSGIRQNLAWWLRPIRRMAGSIGDAVSGSVRGIVKTVGSLF